METGRKQFRKRNAILAALRDSTEHPSAEMVYSRLKPDFPDLSLGTVYRNLSMFKVEGMIASLGTVNGVERFDGNVEPHAHFICTHCNAVMDLPRLQVPEELSHTVNRQTGGKVDICQLSFTGLCRSCLEAQGQESSQTA